MDGEALRLERGQLLFNQIGDELGRRTGWQAEVSRRVGVSESLISKVLKGTQAPGTRSIERIRQTMGLSPNWFYLPDIGRTPHYRDHLEGASPKRAASPSHWIEFASSWPRFNELTDFEKSAIRGMLSDYHEIRHWTDWIAVAEWYLGRRRPSVE